MTVIKWWKLSIEESYLVVKDIFWWKLASDESYLVMKVILWWKLFSDESLRSWNCQGSDKEWWLVTFRLWRCLVGWSYWAKTFDLYTFFSLRGNLPKKRMLLPCILMMMKMTKKHINNMILKLKYTNAWDA